MRVILYTDGASRGNPGPAAIGIVLVDAQGMEIAGLGETIGTAKNNEAEYRALLRGLECAAAHRATEIEVRTDSLLMAMQLTGKYKVRAPNLRPLFERAQRALATFQHWDVRHVRRELNGRADALANEALDR